MLAASGELLVNESVLCDMRPKCLEDRVGDWHISDYRWATLIHRLVGWASQPWAAAGRPAPVFVSSASGYDATTVGAILRLIF